MIPARFALPVMTLLAATVVAGCGGGGQAQSGPAAQPALPPLTVTSGPVTDVVARCGVQGLYWQNSWWTVAEPIQKVKDENPIKTLDGTITVVGNDQARLDSPDLEAPQMLWRSTFSNPNSPPYQLCAPTTQ